MKIAIAPHGLHWHYLLPLFKKRLNSIISRGLKIYLSPGVKERVRRRTGVLCWTRFLFILWEGGKIQTHTHMREDLDDSILNIIASSHSWNGIECFYFARLYFMIMWGVCMYDMCVCVWAHMCHCEHVEAEGQPWILVITFHWDYRPTFGF